MWRKGKDRAVLSWDSVHPKTPNIWKNSDLTKKQTITIRDDAILNDLLFGLFWFLVGVAELPVESSGEGK